MSRKKSYRFRNEQKNKRRGLAITLIVIGALFSVSAIAWIWWNDWDVRRSYEQVVEAVESSLQVGQSKLSDKEANLDEQEIETSDQTNDVNEETPEPEITAEEAMQYIENQELPEEPTYVDGILIANKRNPLPSTFAPGESEEARAAFEMLAAAASLEGFRLTAFSTYRSFDYQVELYDRYVERDGVEEADRYSARPGYSEHQTGLAFDIGEVGGEEHWASSSFGDTAAGKWLAEHAHLYGFIMRYPEGKESITGYMHEAWHFRYVGEAIAQDIYENNATLEEYLGLVEKGVQAVD